jgi:flagellar hook protein FlgE
MMRSLFAGVSGLRIHQTRMDVIGNNIANINTNGFKAGRVTFQDVLSQTIQGARAPEAEGKGGVNPMQVGLGATIGSIDTLFAQGNLQSTGKATDLAIQGDGFFVLSDGARVYYTRDGAFDVSADGSLVHAGTGMRVQGWQADANGNVDTTQPLGSIVIPLGQQIAPKATTTASFAGNLNSAVDAGGAWSTTVTVFDSLGNSHDVTVTFTKSNYNAATSSLDDVSGVSSIRVTNAQAGKTFNVWWDSGTNEVVATDDGGTTTYRISATSPLGSTTTFNFSSIGLVFTVDAGTNLTSLGTSLATSKTVVGRANTWDWVAAVQGTSGLTGNNGQVLFTSSGAFSSSTGGPITWTPSGAAALSITPDFSTITQYAGASTVGPSGQDGYATGSLDSFNINSAGIITGVYSNGRNLTLGQIATARFANPGGLMKAGSNLYQESPNSGVPQVGMPDSGGRGPIFTGALEMSNVDLAQEFTNMIIAQRGFQANSRIITTADEMLQDMIALRR